MSAYSGHCEIARADGVYVVANATLLDDEAGTWYGRLTCYDIDWFAVEQQAAPLAIRLPTGTTGRVTVTRYTYLLPAQATVTGSGPRPW